MTIDKNEFILLIKDTDGNYKCFGIISYDNINVCLIMKLHYYRWQSPQFSGYGHIAPSTNTGRLITIVYAIFGIPIFLILLADFGKMFTRGIKFLWAFVRRLYYTGSCRKVRRTAPVQVSK